MPFILKLESQTIMFSESIGVSFTTVNRWNNGKA